MAENSFLRNVWYVAGWSSEFEQSVPAGRTIILSTSIKMCHRILIDVSCHLPLCRATPGALRSHYTFEPKTAQGTSRWFCIYEAEYANEAALNAALTTPEGKRAGADVANCSPDAPTVLIYKLEAV